MQDSVAFIRGFRFGFGLFVFRETKVYAKWCGHILDFREPKSE